MSHPIGRVLSFGVGVALSPVPIIAVVLMLATPTAPLGAPSEVRPAIRALQRGPGERHG